MKKTLSVIAAVLVCTACFSAPASGLMVGLSTEKLTRDAELVVTGQVEDTVCQWTADKKAIVTKAVISVEQYIKGISVRQKIEVMRMGGQIGDLVMAVSDEPPLQKGERVLLFLSPEHELSGGAACKVQGRAQGKYSIGEDLIARKWGFTVDAVSPDMDNAIPVEKLTEKIRRYIDEQ